VASLTLSLLLSRCRSLQFGNLLLQLRDLLILLLVDVTRRHVVRRLHAMHVCLVCFAVLVLLLKVDIGHRLGMLGLGGLGALLQLHLLERCILLLLGRLLLELAVLLAQLFKLLFRLRHLLLLLLLHLLEGLRVRRHA
jgi:hypothetical protein